MSKPYNPYWNASWHIESNSRFLADMEKLKKQIAESRPGPTWVEASEEDGEEEPCEHSDDTECGHCIDCGEYVGFFGINR